jgi:hypothetical protein
MGQNSEGQNVLVQGRVIWLCGATIFTGAQKKNQQTRQPIIGTDGQPIVEYGFGLAVPKNDFQPNQQANALWVAMQQEAMKIFPNGVPPQFAWKWKDGDSADQNGVPYSQRVGHGGCLVLALTTRMPIKFYIWNETKQQNEVVDQGIKCGDYLQVQVNVKAHPSVNQGKPGLYLNPYSARVIGYGPEIVHTPNGDAIFGIGAPPTMGSPTPIGTVSTPFPGAQPANNIAPQAQPGFAPVQPHVGILPQQFQQPVQQFAQQMPAMQQPVAVPQAGMMPMPGAPQPQPTMQQPTGMPPIPGFPQR